MEIKLNSVSDAESISAFYIQNADHLRKWEPLRPDGYHAVDAWRQRLKSREQEQEEGRAAYFIAYTHSGDDIAAHCALTNIIRGSFQACHIGFAAAACYEGKGIMTELCHHAIQYAFDELNLHRIMANYMPDNRRSEALLTRLGFIKEGLAKNYLKINGQWQDHVLTSLINPRTL